MLVKPLYSCKFLFLLLFLWAFNSCKDENGIKLLTPEIHYPRDGSLFYKGESIRISVESFPGMEFSHLEVYLDELFLLESEWHEADTIISHEILAEGSHSIEAHAIDIHGNTSTSMVSFHVEDRLEESDDAESFHNDPVTGWTFSGWILASSGLDDGSSLYSSADHAFALTKKQYDQAGSISFYVKKGSENLKFMLDGELKAKWFGLDDWGYYAYSVPSGSHVFRWESETEGVYLDNVVFSPGLQQHTPGEIYEGGTIFYLDSTGLHGLIAAFEDGKYNGIPEIPWGCYGLNILSGNRAKSYTDGEGNTRAIVQDCDQEQIAARYCYDLTTFHNDSIQEDWYLPAVRELKKLYSNRAMLYGLDGEYYWSSTSFSSSAASVYNFLDGSHHGAHRNIPNVSGPVSAAIHVRPIRKF